MRKIKKLPAAALIVLLIFVLSAFGAAAAAGDEPGPSGAYLKYTVDVDKTNVDGDLAFCYWIIKANPEYVLSDGDTLEYDVWISQEETGWGHIDGDLSGANLRDRGFSDNEGNGFHTGQDISYYAYETWWHRSVRLGYSAEEAEDEGINMTTAGIALKNIQLSMHPAVSEDLYQGYALYDNIVITNNGEVKCVIFKDEGDLDPNAFKYSHSQGAVGKVEILTFTQAELDAFEAAKAAKIAEAASIEASKAEAEASREASREQANIEASIKQSEDEAEAAKAENETENEKVEKSGSANTIIIIIAVCAAVLIIVIIIIAVFSKGKKKGDKK